MILNFLYCKMYMKMDNKDIAITVLAILNVVTFAVLMYLMVTRNRNTAGGQFGSRPSYVPAGGYLPNYLKTYFTEDMNDRHKREINDITERLRRRVDPNLRPTLWDYVVEPFSEGLDEAGMRHMREINKHKNSHL